MQFHTKNAQLQHDTYTEKRHYKMFKSGKHWVVAGISLLFAGSMLFAVKPDAVHAATDDANGATNTQTSQAASTTAAAQNSDDNAVPLKSGTAISASTDSSSSSNTQDDQDASTKQTATSTTTATQQTSTADTTNTTAADAAAQNGSAKSDASAADSSKATTTASTTTADQSASDTAASADQKTADSAATATQSADTATAGNTAASTNSADDTAATAATTTDTQVTNLGSASAEQLSAAKTTAAATYASTKQAQKVTAALPATASTATIGTSASKVGYGSGLTSLTVTYSINNAAAGDVYSVTIPADNAVLDFHDHQVYSQLDPSEGTTTLTQNADGSRTVTNTFTKDVSGNTTMTIQYVLLTNYSGQATPIDMVGDTKETVTIAKNGVTVGSKDFTITIQPVAHPTPVTQVNPDGSNTSTAVLPESEYVYSFAVNEVTGVLDGTQYPSGQVNSAVNYGTTITIPVPTGFTLDAAATTSLNAFTDQTTITQAGGAGGDITITVPKGSGLQNYTQTTASNSYKIVGSYVATQSAADQTLTASGPATMVQQVDASGTTFTFSNDSEWTATLAGTDNTTATAATVNASIRGNSTSAPTALVLDDDTTDDPEYLLTAGFQYQGSATSDATITLTIPDGFDATSVTVPSAGATNKSYLPDTTNYGYTMTLADGTVKTGTVDAGEKVTSDGSAIRSVVFTPNELSGWSSTGNMQTGSNFDENTGTFFQVEGTLAAFYDDGTAVKNGDAFTATISVAAPGAKTATASVTQTVTTPVSRAGLYKSQTSTVPGQDSGEFAIFGSGGNWGQSTNKIYEPILYYVLPSSVSIKGYAGTQDAAISTSVASDGRIIVTIDYTGTGESVDLGVGAAVNNAVLVTNNADALSGSYAYAAYIYSPNTQLMQTILTPDASLTGGHADAVEMADGKGTWQIVAPTSTSQVSLAQGDDVVPVQNATADKNSTAQLAFFTSIVNTAGDAGSADLVVNLPTVGDDQNSEYTFNLTGPIDLPTDFTTTGTTEIPLDGTVLYSTQLNDMDTNSTSASEKGYVTADEVTDWSTIRSILIELNSLPAQTSTGRIALDGKIADMVDQGQRTGTIETALFINGAKAAFDDADATLEITGSSTIKARAHYVDDNGNDQYLYFTDIDRTLLDNTDKVPALTTFVLSADDEAQIPSGYSLVSTTPTYVDSQGNGTPVAGDTVTNADDGDYAQFELVADEVTLKVNYIDEDTDEVVSVPSSTLTSITGAPGTSGTYTAVVPAGYTLAAGQSATPSYTLAADSNKYTLDIKLNRVLDYGTATTTRTINYVYADGTPAAPSVTQTVNWKTTTDTVSGETAYTAQNAYFTLPSPTITGYTASQATVDLDYPSPTSVAPTNAADVTVTYTADTQNATVNFETSDGTSLGSVAITGASGSDVLASSYQDKLAELEAANYTVKTNGAAGAKFDTDSATPQTFNIVMNAPVSLGVTYVDDAEGGSTVTVPDTTVTSITGAQDSTGTYTAVVPTNYALAKGQAASVAYTLSAGATGITIHLTHAVTHGTATTTRTINYVIADGGATAPAAQVQSVTWNTSTDQVTGATIATPQNAYAAQASPTVAGYTPDQTTVASDQPAATTEALADATDVTVTYTADTQSATINFVTTDGKSLGSTSVSGASGSAIPASSYEATLTALEDQGYTVQSDGAVGASFDYDSTQNQSFTVVLLAPSSTNNGGGTSTGNNGGTTTGNNGGTTTGNNGGTTTGNNGGTTTGNNGGTTTGNNGGTTTGNNGGTTTGNNGGTTTGDNSGTTTGNNGGTSTGDNGNTTGTLPDTDGGTGTTGDDDGNTPHVLPDTDGGSTTTSTSGSTGTVKVVTTTDNAGKQTLPATSAKSNAVNDIQTAAAKQNVLPQTGDDNNSALAVIGVGLAGLLSMFGLGRKRKHEDD